MANLGIFEINTNGEYKTIEYLTNLTFEVGKTYTLQVQNKLGYLTICSLDTPPTDESGVILKDLEKINYTPVENVNCYLKTSKDGSVLLNIMD